VSAFRLVLPLLTLLGLFVAWQSGHRWIAFAALGLLIAGVGAVPPIVRRKLELFDKQAMKLLATGKAAQVEALSRSNILLEMLGPQGCMDGKVGLAMLETGRYGDAASRLASALRYARGPAVLPLQVGLCKAYLLINDPSRSEAVCGEILRSGFSLPEVLAVRAVSAFLLGKHEAAKDHCTAARSLSHNADVALMLDLLDIELSLSRGLERELAQGMDSAKPFLAAWIHLLRGKLRQRRGKAGEAASSFRKALELDKAGFVGAQARRLLEIPEPAPAGNLPIEEPHKDRRDPMVARKKKRR
jgi:tetratricopeptide (TPR) repeat protein